MQDNEEEDEDQLIIAADSDTERFSDNDMDDEQPISLESLTKKVEILTNKVIEVRNMPVPIPLLFSHPNFYNQFYSLTKLI